MAAQGSAPNKQIAQFRSDGVTAATGLRVPFFTDSFARQSGLPTALPINMMQEETPLREERPYVPFVGLREIHYSRPALVTGSNLGSGPIRGVFRAPLSYGGGLFIVSGQTAYNVATSASCGTIPGADKVRWAASEDQMVLVANGSAYLFDGANFNLIVNGTLPAVVDVAWLGGRFVYIAAGTDQLWYSEIDDAANEGGLDFATAESSPDPSVAVGVIADELVIFGTQSVEFWSVTTDATAPFAPNTGRGYQRGCISRDSVTFADNALFWVGDNRVVYRAGNAPTRVSSYSIEDKLRQCLTPDLISTMTLATEAHEFVVLTVPGVGTYAYDISRIGTAAQAYGDSYERGEWQEWQSWGQPVFRGQVAASIKGTFYVGDNSSNDLWTLQEEAYNDANGPFTRMASAFIKVEEGSPRCLNIVFHGVVGQGLSTGAGSNPVVEMRYSDDQGRTFNGWRQASLGRIGAYLTRPFWNRLGSMRAPGRLVQVRCSDPVNFTASHIELNASRPAN